MDEPMILHIMIIFLDRLPQKSDSVCFCLCPLQRTGDKEEACVYVQSVYCRAGQKNTRIYLIMLGGLLIIVIGGGRITELI